MRTYWRLLALVALGTLGNSGGCGPENPSGNGGTIENLPGVRFVSVDEWFQYKNEASSGAIGTVLLPRPTNDPPFVSGIDPFAQGFVKPQVCGECHREIYASYLKTAHHRTAAEANVETVLGSFAEGKNELKTRDPNLQFKMIADERGLHQQLSVRRDGRVYTHDVPMHISTGSGNHGQSYLYWMGNALFQLPVSYFTEVNDWVNSPGLYQDGTADFARGIGDRCLDCHATYFAESPGTFNQYDRTNYILGVTCVRCHGPGWAHVQFHKHHSDESEARYIVNPKGLSRERANEVCAQCHSGAGQLRQSAFSYRPGQPLADYITLDFRADNEQNDDPHAANQLLRLMKSRCHTESDNLTCFTCHDPHENERGNLSQYSKRCAKCHEVKACGLFAELGGVLAERCVSCHMPSRRDAEGVMRTAKGDLLPLLRDHYIQARPPAIQEMVEEIRRDLSLKKTNSPSPPPPVRP